ncbi:hypothetical protein WJX74_006013 [Apatococcus lobatus]|uniref:RNase III domain-containing protein n=1 Tax=Apatococcus lobatus TaxID=904363 RepID=A0AAW1RC89_9CHLO
MLSSKLGHPAQRQCWRTLCHPQNTTNIQLSQQDLLHWAAQGSDEPLTVTLQVPAQQLVATVTTSAPAEPRRQPVRQPSKYSFEAEPNGGAGPSRRSIHVRVWQSQNRVPTPPQLVAAQRELRYDFKDVSLLKQAFIAPGAAHNSFSNRPLAWFGDAALTMLVMEGVASRLARQDAQCLETGEPTLLRDKLVARETCCRNVKKLQLHALLLPSYGGKVTDNMMAELFEALLGAIYLDGGLSAARYVYHTHWPLPDELVISHPSPAATT